MNAEDFKECRSALAGMIWVWLESMNKERGVNWCEGTQGKLIKDAEFYTDDCYGEALLVSQTYPAGMIVEGMDIDPTRTIEVRIGHAKDSIPVVRITSSLCDRPLDDIVGGSDGGLLEAIRFVHGNIFQGWPPTKDEIDAFIRRQFPDESK